MLDRAELLEQVIIVLRGPCGVSENIVESSRLGEDLRLDSMGHLALAVNIENRFRVRLEEDPTAPPRTVAEVVDLLQSTLQSKSSS